MCSSRKYPYPPPHAQRRATELPRGEGVQNEAISEGGGGGVAYRGFFPGGLSKTGEFLIITASLLSKPSVILLLPVFQHK